MTISQNRVRRVLIGATIALLTMGMFPAVASSQLIDGCGLREPTIAGTTGDDVLIGTPGDDVILGYGGNDVIKGRGGNDVICGGDGDDKLFGNAGNDSLYGDAGDDKIVGHRGQDSAFGGPGNDKIVGRADQDDLHGGPGDDTIQGGNGDDLIEGETGNDKLFGGKGNDRLAGVADDNTLRGGPGDDVLVGGIGIDSVRGGPGADFCATSDTEIARCESVEVITWRTIAVTLDGTDVPHLDLTNGQVTIRAWEASGAFQLIDALPLAEFPVSGTEFEVLVPQIPGRLDYWNGSGHATDGTQLAGNETGPIVLRLAEIAY